MRHKSYLDLKTYRVLKSGNMFIFSGWFFSCNGGKYTIKVLLNGKEEQFDYREEIRKDVAEKFKKYHVGNRSGFRIKILVPDNILPTELKIVAVMQEETYTIVNLNENDIRKITDDETLQYSLDDIAMEEKKDQVIFRMRGWAFSFNKDSEVEYRIIDSAGQHVDYTSRPLNREDLYKKGIVDKEKKQCGFQIEFMGEKGKDYWFRLNDPMMAVKKKLNSEDIAQLKRRKKKINIVRNVVMNLSPTNIRKGVDYAKKHGIKGLLERVEKGRNTNGLPYSEWYENNKITEAELKKQRIHQFKYAPTISIIVPTYKTPIKFFREMVDSVRRQTYPNWELCLGDGSEGDVELEKAMREYHDKDNRIKYTILEKNFGISGNTNGALTLATGEYIGLLDHDDVLEPHALYEVVKVLNQDDFDIVYTDEDKVSGDLSEHSDPNFKPDWSPDLFCSHNYITHFFITKKSIIDKIGGFRSEFDGAQDYDLMFRCIENSTKIKHIAKILYNWRMHEASVAGDPASKMYAYEAGRKAIEDHYRRVGIDAQVEHTEDALWGMYHTVYNTPGDPLVSIIIPNKDHVDDLDNCLTSLYQNNVYQNFEIVIVENNSEKEETFSYYDSIQSKHDNITVLDWKKEFNYAAINNYGVSKAKGKYLLLLNNDTEIINDTAIKELLGCCMRDDVGIVGAKLLYNDDTVQHAGIVIGFGGFAGHVFTGIGKDDYGFMVRPRINCNYSAVTAACMMVDRNVFEEVHGFTEEFKVGLNDVDLCLKVRETGKLVVYNAFSLWYHYESKSRGYEDTEEKIKRFENEIRLFQKKWRDILVKGDPYYNKNFPIELGPFRLG